MVPIGEVESYRPSDSWIAVGKGVLLATANVVVIALGLGVAGHNPAVAVVVTILGGIPAVVLGGLLGLLSGVFARRSPRWRAVLLALPAFGLVALLGSKFELTDAVPVACIPTLVAALVLERWTRIVRIPVATARSPRT